MNLFLAALSTLIVNLPFGYWRSRVPKMSWQGLLAIHLPGPVVILFRCLFDLGFKWTTYPVMVLAFFLGQLFGGMIKKIEA